MKEIRIKRKEEWLTCFVDDEDYDWVINTGSIYVSTGGYAQIYLRGSKPYKYARLARLIYSRYNGLLDHEYIDHINGDILDNQKINLRRCSHQENMRNRFKVFKPTLSLYKGVKKNENHWLTRIKVDKTTIHIGNFVEEKDAALAYDIYARRLFGEFAKTNFPSITKEDEARIEALCRHPQQNKRVDGSSKYKGVTKNGTRYYSTINFQGKKYKLGSFKDEIEAAKAHDVKAREFYGSLAKTNFPV